jgi:hypothetical protein
VSAYSRGALLTKKIRLQTLWLAASADCGHVASWLPAHCLQPSCAIVWLSELSSLPAAAPSVLSCCEAGCP